MIIVRFAAIRRASARMASAETSVIPAAHSGVLAMPSLFPVRYCSNRSHPTQHRDRNPGSCRFSSCSTYASPSISAASVFGRGAIHSGETLAMMSVSNGLTFTKWQPFACAARTDSASVCRPTPPEVTCAFLRASPPKATTNSVCSAITGHEVAVSRMTDRIGPTKCGVIALAAAYE